MHLQKNIKANDSKNFTFKITFFKLIVFLKKKTIFLNVVIFGITFFL